MSAKDINKELESIRLLLNNQPAEDFEGLSPSEMHILLRETFTANSILKFKHPISHEVLTKIPFFRICEDFLQLLIVETKPLKLTLKGNLPRKFCKELYSKGHFYDEGIEQGIYKTYDEERLIEINSANHILQLIRATRHNKNDNKLYLTTEGKELMNNREKFFKKVFIDFSIQYNWAYHDLYDEFPIGQLGFCYSIFLLKKFGNEKRTKEFYAEKYLRAFPKVLTEISERPYSTIKESAINCYTLRSFDRFLEWFGLVSVEKGKKFFSRTDTVWKSEIFDKVFEIPS